jgi:hypothetical protein
MMVPASQGHDRNDVEFCIKHGQLKLPHIICCFPILTSRLAHPHTTRYFEITSVLHYTTKIATPHLPFTYRTATAISRAYKQIFATMASRLLRNTLLFTRPTARVTSRTPFIKQSVNDLSNHTNRPFSITAAMAAKVDASFISQITAAEKQLTGTDEPVKGGPTAMAQKHVGQNLTAQVVHDITEGEKVRYVHEAIYRIPS